MSAKDHAIIGAEALVRWKHPVTGLRPPADFFQVAEQLRLMGQFDEVTLRNVLAWRDSVQDVPLPTISGLQRLDSPSGAISFEILETVFSDRRNRLLRWNLDGLREMGLICRLTITAPRIPRLRVF